ncbi:uncharacterized protein Z519_04520 [Cladophialophora bantiana CBS 173.52]|uniref:Glycosyltransferase 2-like domain-containing protein n=1 Tax=Cladophialophora bantiana (strain ATCC 10958 / CBS 173.52 / CDC B-1940 / NIH 8579) TaxID=1442370 RepID=A0A0D2ICR8_CLAB1|nr:uncharacterized protein Z519_04520 [Cladophialophora bantiana CBS 173.52]KIW94544.1 hypothetical protein Z519_04520 [Cladophialophora bantiana CBS 173.52]
MLDSSPNIYIFIRERLQYVDHQSSAQTPRGCRYTLAHRASKRLRDPSATANLASYLMPLRPSLTWLSPPTLLGAFTLWDFIEHRISDRNRKRYREFPLPPPEIRAYNFSDVSIIIPTVDTDPTFSECLGGLLKNRPLEVLIITTVEEEDRVRALVRTPSVEDNLRGTDIHILTVPKANKRD